jgi:N-acylglucosamine 2-epimerase
METLNVKKLHDFYYSELMDDCLPFWIKNSIDRLYGGYQTCLDRKGEIYNTDKSVWFQGRCLWTYSKVCNELGRKDELMDAAKTGYDFLLDHCFDKDGRMFFIVTRDGRPVQKRRYYFSETFAVISLVEYSKASGNAAALEKAKEIYWMIMGLYRDPSKIAPKYYIENVKMKSMAVPMILLSTTQCLRDADKENEAVYNEIIDDFIKELLRDYVKDKEEAMFEHVGLNGEKLDSPKGRLINPGHAIEAAWFLMSEGIYRNDKKIIDRALMILDWSMDIGWDDKYGGIFYFVDIEGRPAEQLEWDMKLWWPHTEALYALLLAYYITKDDRYVKRFEMVHDYSFNGFRDKEYGEWFGYLHRDGSVSNTLKGSMFKGPFHLPRALLLMIKLLDRIKEN